MFGNKSKEPQQQSSIPVVTIDHFPDRQYEVIGTVVAEYQNPNPLLKGIKVGNVIPALQASAEKVNADAVLGMRMYQTIAGDLTAYGTAIRFK